MNPIQKQWLGLGVALVLVMFICPPWTRITQRVVLGSDRNLMQTETQDFAGYSLLFSPPQARQLVPGEPAPVTFPGDFHESVRIDFERLLVQWLTVAFLTGAGLLFFKGSDKNSLAEWWSAVGGAAKPTPPSSPLKPRPSPTAPVSRSLVPPAIGRSETKQRTPPNESSPWCRAQKKAGIAFGIGSFVGIASAYQGNVATGFPFAGRMLFTLFGALFIGLLFAAVTFVVAGLYFAAKGGSEVAEGRSSLTASTKSRPTSAPPKPTAPDSPSSKAQASLAATLDQAEKVLRQATPISEKQLPTNIGSRNPPGASPTPRAAQWLYFDQQACRRGPVCEAELEKLFASGVIRAGASVWSDGLPEWVPFLQRHRQQAPPVSIVLGNREEGVNDAVELVVREAQQDVNFQFQAASRVGDFIQLATRPETRLAIFMPPGNLQLDPGTPCATPEQEAVRIIKAIKAETPIPVIVMAVQHDARETLLAAGADVFLDVPPQGQEIADAVAKCLGLEPKLKH